jgi:hypothetical protein
VRTAIEVAAIALVALGILSYLAGLPQKTRQAFREGRDGR